MSASDICLRAIHASRDGEKVANEGERRRWPNRCLRGGLDVEVAADVGNGEAGFVGYAR